MARKKLKNQKEIAKRKRDRKRGQQKFVIATVSHAIEPKREGKRIRVHNIVALALRLAGRL